MSTMSTTSLTGTTFTYDSSLAESDRTAIRLLILWPATEDDHGIHITLTEHYFDQCPSYEALSYTWDDASQRSTIDCNGQTLSITSSLFRVLKYLRGAEERLLWIDQISIDQNNDREKGQQVAMMKEIYRYAKQTVAWLGDTFESTSRAFDTLHYLAKGREAFSPARLLADDNPWTELETEGKRMGFVAEMAEDPKKYWGIAAPRKSEFNAVLKLLSSPWFTRMWIIQEASIPQQLLLQSGCHSIPMEKFIFGFYVMQTMVATGRGNQSVLSRGGTDMLQTLTQCRYAHQAGDDMSIAALVYMCREFKATDQRDRLFALFGVTSSPLTDLGLSTDYTTEARYTLAASFVRILRDDQSLRLLELTETQSESDLPSWIPHQRVPSDPKPYPLSGLRNIDHLSSELTMLRVYLEAYELQKTADRQDDHHDGDSEEESIENPWDSALKDLLAKKQLEQEQMYVTAPDLDISLLNADMLCIPGQFLDRIVQVSALAGMIGTTDQGDGTVTRDHADFVDFEGVADTDDDAGVRDLFRATREMAGYLGSYIRMQLSEWKQYINSLVDIDAMVMGEKKTAHYASEKAILDGYRNTLTAGSLLIEPEEETNEFGFTEEQSVHAFNRWRNTMKGAYGINKFKKRLGMKSASGAASMIATSLTAHSTYDFDSKIMLGEAMKALPSRRLAWTARGHLAMVPAKAAVNDHIFALKGSLMQFVLRSHEGNWKILGPTYVDGVMKGELHDDDAIGPVRLV